MAGRQPERRQAPWWIPIASIAISSIGLVLGPCFGAGVAVIGTYVAMQTKSAVTDTKLESIQGDVKIIKDQLQTKGHDEGKTEATLSDHERRLSNAERDITSLRDHDGQQERTIATIGGMTAADANNSIKKK